MKQMERIARLKEILSQSPNDSFVLYALGLEYASLNDSKTALEYFQQVLKNDPECVACYYQKALAHLKESQKSEAKSTLEAGIPKAVEAGQFHTRDKMKQLLKNIG